MKLFVLFVLLFPLLGFFGCLRTTFSVKPVYGNTNPSPEQIRKDKVRRYGSVIELLPEKEQLYRELHANVWSDVINATKKAKIRNYNIYVTEIGNKKYLFSYLEYRRNSSMSCRKTTRVPTRRKTLIPSLSIRRQKTSGGPSPTVVKRYFQAPRKVNSGCQWKC